MLHLERVGPTTAGGKDRAMKVQLLKGTEQLGVHNIITSWYLQFTESYKPSGLKKSRHPTCAYSHADTELMQTIKKNLTHFIPFIEMLHIVHPQIN